MTDSKLLQKFPALTEPKIEMKSLVQNAQETRDEGVGDGYGTLRDEAQRAERKSGMNKAAGYLPFHLDPLPRNDLPPRGHTFKTGKTSIRCVITMMKLYEHRKEQPQICIYKSVSRPECLLCLLMRKKSILYR